MNKQKILNILLMAFLWKVDFLFLKTTYSFKTCFHFSKHALLVIIARKPLWKVRTANLHHCHWLRSPSRRINIFRYSRFSKKRYLCYDVALTNRRGEKESNIFVYKIFTNNFFKSFTSIALWRCALAKWRHCKGRKIIR